ncbi:MAG TPA: hypothetical protein VKU01_23250 [Bryobacteraceae bacterium]|nr:hypothetical protein [Bryobacteraceae bacterium]
MNSHLYQYWSKVQDCQFRPGHLRIIHESDPLGAIESDSDLANLIQHSAPVLFVSGGGFDRDDAVKLFKRFPLRNARCLMKSFTDADPEYRNFIAAVERSAGEIPWHLIKTSDDIDPDAVSATVATLAQLGETHRYSDPLEFEQLWRLDRLHSDKVIIIWDTTPHPVINGVVSDRYFTPFDWAAAIRMRYPHDRSKIVILDLTGNAYGLAPAITLWRTAPGILPNVVLTADAAAVGPSLKSMDGDRVPDTVLLRQIWLASHLGVDNARDRHAIANLIGPHVLLRYMGIAHSDACSALENLLDALGVVPPLEPDTSAWIDPPLGAGRVLLIDDMAELGWSNFLKRALGTDRVLSIDNRDGGNQILGLLESNACENDFVFLDLRLFGAYRESGPAQEQVFLKGLAEIASRLNTDDAALKADAAHVTQCEFSVADNETYYIALTLLPRLLAAANPKTPVILFSSTGHKEVYDRVRGYPTIITDFDKPRFTNAYSTSTIDETRQRFRAAVDKARRIARARDACVLLSGTPQALTPAKHAGPIVEIYVDESGDPAHPKQSAFFAVGGICLSYPDETEISTLADQLLEQGIIWGSSVEHGLSDIRRRRVLEKHLPNDVCDPTLSKIEQILSKLDIQIRAIAIVEKWPSTVEHGVLDGDSERLFRQQLSASLEATLFDLIARSHEAKEVHIHAATRMVEVGVAKAQDYESRFRIEAKKKESPATIFSLSANEIYPLVNNVCRLRPKIQIPITVAHGSILNPSARHRPRQIHYLADWVSRFARRYAESTPLPPIAEPWFEAGFLDLPGSSFPLWLEAAREADNGDRPRAVALSSEALKTEAATSGYPFGRWIKPRAADWARNLTAEEFRRLCADLDRSESLSANANTVAI